MSKPVHEVQVTDTTESKVRFGISTLLILTLIAGMIAGFFREQGPRGLIVIATTTPIAIAVGAAVGCLMGSMVSRLFWAVVAATIIQIITSNVLLGREPDYFAWPIVAAICAAVLGGPFNHVFVRMLIGACVAAASFAIYVLVLTRNWSEELTLELWVAIKCGALLAALIEICSWLERRLRIPQSAVAFALVLLAIGTAWLAPKLIPGW